MAELPLAAHGSGEGLAPVAAAGESPARAAREARTGEALTPRPLTGGVLWGVGVLLALANFVVVLDTTIANVSVPTIAGGLGVSANEGTWVITSYSVAEAITVPLTGWLAQRFGSVRTFCAALVLFAIFSALCGLSPSLNVLVVFRVLQGLSGGPMIPLSQTLLLRVFPKEQAGQALGLWAMTTVVAPIAGPILGGLICDNYTWPFIFLINVPVALLAAVLAWRLLLRFEDKRVRLPIDGVGLGLMVVWIGALQILLDKGEDDDWFNSPFIVHLAIIAVIGFLAFLIWELTDNNPVINLRVFRNKNYVIGLGVMCLCYGCYFASVVIQPLWLQTNLGYTATWAGFAVAPVGIFAIIMSPIVGALMKKTDPRILLFIGVCGIAATMLWRSSFTSNINFGHLVLPQLFQGGLHAHVLRPRLRLGPGLAQAAGDRGRGGASQLRADNGRGLRHLDLDHRVEQQHPQWSHGAAQPDRLDGGRAPDRQRRPLPWSGAAAIRGDDPGPGRDAGHRSPVPDAERLAAGGRLQRLVHRQAGWPRRRRRGVRGALNSPWRYGHRIRPHRRPHRCRHHRRRQQPGEECRCDVQ